MNAIQMNSQGDPEVLKIASIPEPEPQAGQLLIRVEASGVNYVDVYHRDGEYKVPLPYIPGVEGAGTVIGVGRNVLDFEVGDRVAFVNHPGGYAEQITVPTSKAVKLPVTISTETGAAAMLQGITVQVLTTDCFNVRPKDTVLVHAGAGGVGQLLIQVCRNKGARVLSTCSTPEKATTIESLGGHPVGYQDFHEKVRTLTDGRGVNAVYDSIGRATFESSLKCLRPRGTCVSFGHSSGRVPPIDVLTLKTCGSLMLTRPSIGDFIATHRDLELRASELFRWIVDGLVSVRIDRTWPLADAAEAHRYLESRQSHGKLLLIP